MTRVRVTTVAVEKIILYIMNVCLQSFNFPAPYLACNFIFGLSGSNFYTLSHEWHVLRNKVF